MIDKTLDERQNTHGDFAENARVSQALCQIMRLGVNWEKLSLVQREALEMIAHKISRILSGNYQEPDHAHDIAGYATLMERSLNDRT